MDKSTGNPVLINGKEVTAELKFEAKDKDGSVLIAFSFDSSALAGKSLVVFESLYEADGKLIGEHKDILDRFVVNRWTDLQDINLHLYLSSLVDTSSSITESA